MAIRRTSGPLWHIVAAAGVILLGWIVLPGADDKWAVFRHALGASLIGIGAVSVAYDYMFMRRSILGAFGVLSNAKSLEIDHIYASRAEALSDIERELANATGDVKILAISGAGLMSVNGSIARAIQEDHNVHFRMLALNPFSLAARVRVWAEDVYGDEESAPSASYDSLVVEAVAPKEGMAASTLWAGLRRTLDLERKIRRRLRTRGSRSQFSIRFYKHHPTFFLVAVNRTLFIEPYHFGVSPDHDAQAVERDLSKKVAVLRYNRRSTSGAIFENHFDRLWMCKLTNRDVEQIRSLMIQRTAESDSEPQSGSLRGIA